MRVVPGLQIVHRGVNQRAAQVTPYAREMTQVLRLAVAPVQPCENAEDLRRALGAERHVKFHEGRGREIAVGVITGASDPRVGSMAQSSQ